MKKLIIRIIFSVRLFLNKSKEPLYNTKDIINYIVNGYWFLGYKKKNFKGDFHLQEIDNNKYIKYKDVIINYPNAWNNELIIENFNNITNEQTAILNNVNPHKYLNKYPLKPHWVIYDLGAAEGLQSKLWVQHVNKIVLFEPLPSFCEQLNKTFKDEIADGRVIIINEGVTNSSYSLTLENKNIPFDTLEKLIKKYDLPLPNYIKADIEGEEVNFLTSSENILQNKNLELIEITTYHKPTDYITIPAILNQFRGNGHFSNGSLLFNRDGLIHGHFRKKIYHPVIRKCLYSFQFNHT